jgi:hypothetical protein
VPLDRLPDTKTSPTEIDDPELLVHRVLYRNSRVTRALDADDSRSPEERRRVAAALLGANRADLHRLEQVLAARLAAA